MSDYVEPVDSLTLSKPTKVRVRVDRHVAFGIGIHRCIGSNLARMALEEWLGAIPEFGLDPRLPMRWSRGTLRDPRRLPLLLG